jgi:hypothetical protein
MSVKVWIPGLFAVLALLYFALGMQQYRRLESWNHPAVKARIRVAGILALVTLLLFFGL